MGKKKSKRRGKNEQQGPNKGGSFANRPFAGLRTALKGKGREEALQAEARSTKPPPRPLEPINAAEDGDLFVQAMQGIDPLEQRVELVEAEAAPRPMLSKMDDAALVMRHLEDLVHGEIPFDFGDTEEFIEASVAGLDRKIRRKLRRGEYSYEAHLDLHGYSSSGARAVVGEFISKCHREGKRCVLLIHGRGLGSKDNIPVIKNKLAAWLTRGAMGQKVLAYVSARPYDGGTGAVYVLLRGR